MNETDESLEGWGDGKIKEKLSAVYVSIFSWKCKYGNVLITLAHGYHFKFHKLNLVLDTKKKKENY